MKEKIIFREMLSEIKILADKKGNRITKEEVKDFFKNARLGEEHFALIYGYLASRKIEVEGYQPAKAADLEVKSLQEPEANGEDAPCGHCGSPDSIDTRVLPGIKEDAFVVMYLEDLERVSQVTDQEEIQLFEKAAKGAELAKASLIEQYLRKVYELSRDYCSSKIPQGDIIQEGNIGLILAVNNLSRKQNLEDYRNYILEEIENAMMTAVEEQETMSDMDKEMVVRVNHMNEAVQNLEQDLEHKVSLDELSAYLEMPVHEIKDILRMAGDEIDLEGEFHPGNHPHDHDGC